MAVELEAVGHIAHVVRKQRDMNARHSADLLAFRKYRTLAHGIVLPTVKVGRSISTNRF